MTTINTIFDPSRHELINKWLHLVLEGHDFTLTDLAVDAGARRYFRITASQRGISCADGCSYRP